MAKRYPQGSEIQNNPPTHDHDERYPTDAELASALSGKANTTDVDTALAEKANTTDVNTALSAKADTDHGYHLPDPGLGDPGNVAKINAGGDGWEIGVDQTGSGGSGTDDHDQLINVRPVDPATANATRNKHVSNNDAAVWNAKLDAVPTEYVTDTELGTALAAKADASALTAHVDDATDAHDASAISYAGSANLAATDVEAALDELDSEKASTSHEGLAPTGAVQMYAGASAPTGWLLCQGQAVSRTTYAALYAALGGASSPWGQGDGSSTFNVPDMRGRAPIGAGQGTGLTNRTLAAQVGTETHTLDTTQIPAHTHEIQYVNPANTTAGGAQARFGSQGANNATATSDSKGGGGSHPNMQPSVALNFIVKV